MSAPLAAQLTYCTASPSEWKIQKLKRLFSVSSGDFLAPEDETTDGFPVYGGNGIRGYAAKPNCNGRTLLIGRVGAHCGNVHLVDGDFWYSEHALRVFPIKTFSLDFLKHLIRVIDLNQFANRTAQPLINSSTTTDRYAAIPPLPEQQRIAAYLDASCAAIDAAVAAKRRQLETLDALGHSTVFHAVTKGLDPSIPVKASGLNWLGRVPAHWEVRRIKDIAALRSGDFIQAEDISPAGDYPVYGGNGVRGYTSSFTHDGRFALIGRQGALCGNINYAEGKFWATEHAVVATPLKRYDRLWFGELLRAMNLNQYSNAAAQPGLAVDRIKFLQLPVPPLKEQTQISAYIETKLGELKKVVGVLVTQIATLTAYRKSLIHECVTGQRRVTEADINHVKAHG